MKLRDSGLTLVEIMLSTIIAAIAFAIMFQLQFSGSQFLAMGEKKIEAVNDLTRSLDLMQRELRLTQRGKFSLQTISTIDFQVPIDTAGQFTYTGSSLAWGAEGTTGRFIRYTLTDNNLTRTTVNSSHTEDASSNPTIITRNIQLLNFLSYGPSIEIVIVSQQRDNFNRLANAQIRTTVSLRN